MSKDILKFLFSQSFENVDESCQEIFDALKDVESLEVKKGDLDKILKKIGCKDCELKLDPSYAYIDFATSDEFVAFADKLQDAENMLALTDGGWVATLGGDVADTTEPHQFRVKFLDITDPEGPEDAEKLDKAKDDMTALAQQSFDDQLPDVSDKDDPHTSPDQTKAKKQAAVDVPDAKNPENSIHQTKKKIK